MKLYLLILTIAAVLFLLYYREKNDNFTEFKKCDSNFFPKEHPLTHLRMDPNNDDVAYIKEYGKQITTAATLNNFHCLNHPTGLVNFGYNEKMDKLDVSY